MQYEVWLILTGNWKSNIQRIFKTYNGEMSLLVKLHFAIQNEDFHWGLIVEFHGGIFGNGHPYLHD